MKVKDLIAELQKRDPDQDVVIAVRTYTHVYPHEYCPPWDIASNIWGQVVLDITLPKGMRISDHRERKP